MFDLFDFWDGRDGLVDAAKVGDLLRCIGLNPTNALIKRHGGTEKFGMFDPSRESPSSDSASAFSLRIGWINRNFSEISGKSS